MIDTLSCFLAVILFGFLIILPIYVNIFKSQVYDYVKSRIDADMKAERLKEQMLLNKKNVK